MQFTFRFEIWQTVLLILSGFARACGFAAGAGTLFFSNHQTRALVV